MNYKRSFLAALLLIVAGLQTAWAQKLVLYTTDKGTIEFDYADIDSITFSNESVEEDKWVDLGLPSGTLWATCNLGAESPEDYGYYFAWGETEPKDNYTWGTYKWMTAGQDDWSYINKYTFPDGQTDGCWYSGGAFVGDNKQELDPEDDAAMAILGSSWQIPTVAQIYELLHGDYTKAEWTVQNGIYGRKVTSKKNGNSIFLPAAGWRSGATLYGGGETGYYWSNSLGGLTVDYAFPLYFIADYWGVEHHDRFCGHPIRPVHVLTLVSEIALSKSELTLKPGDVHRLMATVSPSDASNRAVKWESSDASVATVNYNGYVTAVSVGTCTITCTAKDGSGTFAQCQVTVKEEDTKEYVDLGLPSGTLWATCNVGASTPEEYGDFFAWGETEPKADYSWETYKWCNGTINSMTKYNATDGLKELLPQDDAATANWGRDWQMPSLEQCEELFNNKYTTTTWTTRSGVNGYLITSKCNNKSIFLPAAGDLGFWDFDTAGFTGSYYSRSLGEEFCDAYCLSFNSEGNSAGVTTRKCGQSVRPVRVKKVVKEYVDLGLPSGTLWATCNVGASTPEEFGDFFAWGETEPKDDYTWETYKWCEGDNKTMTKYCIHSEYGYNGFTDNITTLLSEDDAATANWGSDWQMPSQSQFKELIDERFTTTAWVEQGGTLGRLITSKVNGKSIFLPASTTDDDGRPLLGFYWSHTLSTGVSFRAYSLLFYDTGIATTDLERNFDQSVRPVRVKKAPRVHEYVDLGLPSGTLWATCNVGATSPEEFGDYFAWGETEPKSVFTWQTYKHCRGTYDSLTKYCRNSSYGYDGYIDNLFQLLPNDDAATANWGSDWEMPSEEQIQELTKYCTSVWTKQNGVEGRLLTGPNGSQLFLPASGVLWGEDSSTDSFGSYWSRNLILERNGNAGYMHFDASSWYYSAFGGRFDGHSVRPVLKEKARMGFVDLDLPSGTLWATCNVGASRPEEFGDYFAWGETEPKDDYTWENYKYCEGTATTLTKYCKDSNYGYNGYTDYRTELESMDDAATKNVPGYWQTPSLEQFEELINPEYTTTEFVVETQIGMIGRKITSKSNGNSIFLPCVGNRNGSDYNDLGSRGCYWSRSNFVPFSSSYLWFDSEGIGIGLCPRYYGICVRPVQMTIN